MKAYGMPKTNTLFTLFCALLACALFLPFQAQAEFPERTITITVGMEAGGPTDIATRAMAPGAQAALGKPIVVDNKGGGGGTVALGVLTTAKPDGYTLVACQNVSIVDTPLMQKVPFKPLASITPICAFAASENTALLVKADAPWKTFKDFIDYVKANPGKIKYSTAGIGSGMHVAMEVIAHRDNLKWVHIPYKGTAPARTAILGGHVDACSSGVDWPPFVLSGQLRVLAVHGRERMPMFPDAPTLKELGYAFVSETVHSVVGPAAMPPDVVRKLDAAFKKGTETTEFKGAVEKLYLTPVWIGSQEYDKHLKDKWVKTEKLFKETGIIKEAATQPQ
jgi:tripartite-type tricarboxylate transporter receptor subunit TctC